uniref:Uncharacterized protein n=1 Tax=Arundo donax TaxID=35708 RepID=A0A0A9FD53_ARUDO
MHNKPLRSYYFTKATAYNKLSFHLYVFGTGH